jgi:hypothetical protein
LISKKLASLLCRASLSGQAIGTNIRGRKTGARGITPRRNLS